MFRHSRKYDKIIVTGPHGSGTTILARMIAHDTGKTFLDEASIRHIYVRKIGEVLKPDTVLQAPYALPWAPIYTDEKTLFVLSRRDIDEIYRSVSNSVNRAGKPISTPGFSPEQAYCLWNKIKPLLHNTVEIEYDSLNQHRLWITEEERRKLPWHHKQIDKSGERHLRTQF